MRSGRSTVQPRDAAAFPCQRREGQKGLRLQRDRASRSGMRVERTHTASAIRTVENPAKYQAWRPRPPGFREDGSRAILARERIWRAKDQHECFVKKTAVGQTECPKPCDTRRRQLIFAESFEDLDRNEVRSIERRQHQREARQRTGHRSYPTKPPRHRSSSIMRGGPPSGPPVL